MQRIIADEDVVIPELVPTELGKITPQTSLFSPTVITPSTAAKIAGYIVGSDSSVSELLDKSPGFMEVMTPSKADFFVFTGGSDISPELYGEEPHQFTHAYKDRDKYEVEWYNRIPEGTLKFGICRGAQLLNVLSGGSMYQHVDGHQKYHKIYDLRTKMLVHASSIHHQMMKVGNGGFILATANESSFRFTSDKKFKLIDDFNPWTDPEVVWYEETNSLGVQGHPEYSGYNSEYGRYCMALVKEFFTGAQLDDDLDDILPLPSIS